MFEKVIVVMFFTGASLLAHTGMGNISGFETGFFHPIGGIDHVLAMFAVGLWAAQMNNKAIFIIPISFICMMILGAILAIQGVEVPFVEGGILASILLLGVMIGFGVKMPLFFSSMIVGLFAIFHGTAHATEMPLNMNSIEYATGFVLSTAMLHLFGAITGLVIYKTTQLKISRLAGATIAFAGVFLAIS